MTKLNYYNIFKKIWNKGKIHPIIAVSSLLLTMLGALITIDTASHLILGYIQQDLLWQSTEETKLNKVSPLQSTDYIKSILGTPILSDKLTDNYSSYTFRGRQNWVYLIYENKTEKVEYIAITACGDFHPLLRNNPGYAPIRLGVTKLNSVNISTSAPTWGDIDYNTPTSVDRHYYIPEATGPLGIYEKHYLANPGRHQTIYAGFNSSCGDQVPVDSSTLIKLADTGNGDSLSKVELDNFRSNLTINTFAVTGNDSNDSDLYKIIDSDMEIGVKSHSIEILSAPVIPNKSELEKIRKN